MEGEGFKEAGVTGADGETGAEGGVWVLGGDVAVEEGVHVVGDVVVQPDEQDTGLFEGGGEGLGQVSGQLANGGDPGSVELRKGGVVIRAGKVVACKTWYWGS